MERQKSIVEQADNAQRTFLVLKRLDLIMARTTAIQAARDVNFSGRESQGLVAMMLRANRGSSDSKAYVESFEDLTHEVSRRPIDKQRVKEVARRQLEIESKIKELFTRAFSEENPTDSKVSTVKKEISEVLNNEFKLEYDVRKFSVELLERLRNEKKEAEKKQKHITNWSYALYVAGFLFGLFGQLLGVANTRSE